MSFTSEAQAAVARSGGLEPARCHLPGRRRANQRRVEILERRGCHERLRQLADTADEVRAAVGVELGEDIIEKQ